jgi:hypothetical protein
MKFVPPIAITSALITSSTVAEPAAGETAWAGATNYTVGQIAYLASTHRLYKNALGGVDATSPDASIAAATTPARWQDVGATNRFAMFDLLSNAQTVVASPLTVVITPGQRIGAVGLVGVEADSVTVSMTVGGVLVYSATQSMRLRNTTRWSEYFFGTFGFKSRFGKFDLPMVSNGVLTMTLTKAVGNVKCAGVVLGMPIEVGGVKYDAQSDALDFSVTARDKFGGVTLQPGKTVPTTSQTVWVKSADVGKLLSLRQSLRATPVLIAGLTDPNTDYFEALFVLGFFRKFVIQLSLPKFSLVTLNVEGL